MTQTYEIYENNIDRVNDLVGKFNRKAKKLGAPQVTLKVLGNKIVEERVEIEQGVYRTYAFKVYIVELDAPELIKLNGWKFVARIRHDNSLELNTIFVSPGAELPIEYREAGANCDHCHQNRHRKDTFVVTNGKEFKQVGSACLHDFLGHDPHAVIRFFDMLANFTRKMIDDRVPDNTMKYRYLRVREYLWCTAVAMRTHGWVPSKSEDDVPTRWRAIDLYYGAKPSVYGYPEYLVTDEDTELVDKALEWIRAQDVKMAGDYMFNLHNACAGDLTREENAGIVASLIVAYRKAMGIEIKRQKEIDERAAKSQHVGEVGQRLEMELRCLEYKEFESDWGMTYLHKFEDKDGNIITWWGSKGVADVGQTIVARATVKRHGEYKGVKETIVTRLMVRGLINGAGA